LGHCVPSGCGGLRGCGLEVGCIRRAWTPSNHRGEVLDRGPRSVLYSNVCRAFPLVIPLLALLAWQLRGRAQGYNGTRPSTASRRRQRRRSRTTERLCRPHGRTARLEMSTMSREVTPSSGHLRDYIILTPSPRCSSSGAGASAGTARRSRSRGVRRGLDRPRTSASTASSSGLLAHRTRAAEGVKAQVVSLETSWGSRASTTTDHPRGREVPRPEPVRRFASRSERNPGLVIRTTSTGLVAARSRRATLALDPKLKRDTGKWIDVVAGPPRSAPSRIFRP